MSGKRRRFGGMSFAVAAGLSIANERLRCGACLACSETSEMIQKNLRAKCKANLGGFSVRTNERAQNKTLSDEPMSNRAEKSFL